ncbi:MAG: hypothetical protein ABIH21_00350 [Patescibacteria group bacterium]
MTLMVGYKQEVILLTREAFGKDGKRVLHGQLTNASRSCMISSAVIMQAKNREMFFHPAFENTQVETASEKTGFWIEVRLCEDGKIQIRPKSPFAHDEETTKTFLYPPVEIEHIPVDNVILLINVIWDQDEMCNNKECEGARRSRLDPRRSVLIGIEGRPSVVCRKCFRQMLKKGLDRSTDVVLEGWRIPFHAPVAVFAKQADEKTL